jgi:hypothetical protein
LPRSGGQLAATALSAYRWAHGEDFGPGIEAIIKFNFEEKGDEVTIVLSGHGFGDEETFTLHRLSI